MAEQNSPPRSHPVSSGKRRDSLTGQTITDLFSRSSPSNGGFSGTITNAAVQAQRRRRLSLSTVGLSGSFQSSPTQQPSPFLSRSDSLSTSTTSATSASVDENPFEETDAVPVGGNPTTPFARRMSFGARALRDARHGGSNGNGSGEGFSFAESLRSRAERSSTSGTNSQPSPTISRHHRSMSVSVIEQQPAPQKETPRSQKMPDAFQERILKGDFYMD